jgi:tripartite-type tricarboxylate transporter receptor subunit TctC
MASHARRLLCAGIALTFASAASLAQGSSEEASKFPSKPITMLVGFAAGGSVDLTARQIGQQLQSAGWTVIVKNVTGASGMIAMRELARSAPDGYTLMMGSVSNLAMVPAAMSNPQVSPVRDLTPVVKIGSAPLMLLVSKNSPVNSVGDLLKQARDSGQPLPFASGGVATPPHLASELLASMGGIKLNHVPYRGEAPALVDLIGNQVPVMFANITAAMPQLKGGAVRAIAVSSPARTPVAPSVPTVAESGLQGFNVQNWFGIVAPAGTPAPIVNRIHEAVAVSLKNPELQAKLAEQGMTVENVSSAEFAGLITSENAKWDKIVKAVKIKLD